MPTYRFAFEVASEGKLPAREIQNMHAELEKYFKTVVLPTGSPVAQRSKAEVQTANEEIPYYVHQHDDDNRCDYCIEQADN